MVVSSEMQRHPEDPLMASLQPHIRASRAQPKFCGLRSRCSESGTEKRGGRWSDAQWDRSFLGRPTTARQHSSGPFLQREVKAGKASRKQNQEEDPLGIKGTQKPVGPDGSSQGSTRRFGINASRCCDTLWDVSVASAAADWLRRLEGAGPPGEPPGPLHGVKTQKRGVATMEGVSGGSVKFFGSMCTT